MLRALPSCTPALVHLTRGRAFALSFTILLVLVVAPILSDPLPPLTDYVNHLARMHVMAEMGGNPILADFSQSDLGPVA
jgi:hypothetical protein